MSVFRVHVVDEAGRHVVPVEADNAKRASETALQNAPGRQVIKVKLDRETHPRRAAALTPRWPAHDPRSAPLSTQPRSDQP